MTYTPPCASRENDPNDWFIGKDGRQYSDETLVTEVQVLTALEDAGFDGSDMDAAEQFVIRMTEVAEADAIRRRRHAKDACVVECYFRNKCLRKALEGGEVHGTWGGYFEEELREIRKEIARRDRRESGKE